MKRLIARWLPSAHICHPYPSRRVRVTTWGKSPVREIRSLGSVRRVRSNPCPYRYPYPADAEGSALAPPRI